jgi:hypothetical protein
MAFLRKKGKYFYLVHSVREKDGRIRHRTLAYLGPSAQITPRIRAQVEAEFPDIPVDWKALAGNAGKIIESSATPAESGGHSEEEALAAMSIEKIPPSRKRKDKRLPPKPEKWLEWD